RDGDRPAVERGARATVGGRLDASAALVPRSGVATLGETVDGAVDVRWRNGWIESKALARRRVVGIDASLRADVTWERRLRRIRLTSGRVGYGPVDADLRASVTDWRTDPRLELRLRADRFECQPAVRALPDALLGPYRKIELAGEARPRFTMEFPVEAPDELSIDLDFFPGECRVTALNALESGWPTIEVEPRRDGRVPAPLPGSTSRGAAGTSDARTAESCGANACCHGRPCAPIPGDWSAQRPDDVFWLRKPFVLEMAVDARGEQTVRVGPGLDSFVPLARLPEYVPAAAYLSEEVDFYEDGAWNVGLIQRALRMNFEDHRFVYGGSTVTQQLVKNLFLTRRKTLARKVREALIAWRIQSVVPKDRVLELYLNCIQFGRKVYGIGPAARHYFDKSATELGLKEALFLAAIKPAPWYGDRFMERGSTPEQGWWPDRMREIAGRLVDEGIVSKERVERAAPFVLTWED
ncbi:MAG: transglycosylase domain-containing protein, partial [Bradymonadaceae bacterium]